MRVTTFSPTALRSARAAMGLSQSALARELGRTRTLIAHWEAGRRAPSWDELDVVAGVLGVSADSLHSGAPRGAADGGLVSLRRSRSLTQAEVAERIGVSKSGYAGNEIGRYPVSQRSALALAELFGVSVDVVLSAAAASQARKS